MSMHAFGRADFSEIMNLAEWRQIFSCRVTGESLALGRSRVHSVLSPETSDTEVFQKKKEQQKTAQTCKNGLAHAK